MVTGGGTEIEVSIPFRWEYHHNTLPRKALEKSPIAEKLPPYGITAICDLLDAAVAQARARVAKSAQISVAAQGERSNMSVDLTV